MREKLLKLDGLLEESIDEIIEVLNKLECQEIVDAKILPSKIGTTIEINGANDKTFFIGLGEYGYVEIVRGDSIDGSIVYMPLDD